MRAYCLALIAVAGCGATGGPGGGASNLPVSGSGPFAPLEMEPGDDIDAPVVLTDPAIDLDDPDVFSDGNALTVWVTAHRAGGDDIERADAKAVRQGFGDLEVALSASEPWEGAGVSAPSVIMGPELFLFYQGTGGIGYAVSTDGHHWTKAAGPILPSVGPPAAVRLGQKIRIYYPKNGSLWAAEAPLASTLTFSEIGEMVAGVPYGGALHGRAFARTANTPTGRQRHDLYFTVATPSATGATVGLSTCGFAASFDGLHFTVESTAITDPKQTTAGPTMALYGDGALLLWIQERGARNAVFAGKSP